MRDFDRLGRPLPDFDPLLGASLHLAGSQALEVKGIAFEGRAEFVRSRFGQAVLDELAVELSDATRKLVLDPPLASSWVPFTSMMELDVAILLELYAGDASAHAEVAAAVAHADLSSLYKFMIRQAIDANQVLDRLVFAFSTRVRPGKMTIDRVGERECKATLHDCVLPFYFCEHGIPAWADVGLTLAGAAATRVEQTECRHFGASRCAYRVRW